MSFSKPTTPVFEITTHGRHRVLDTARDELRIALERSAETWPGNIRFHLGLFAELPMRMDLIRQELLEPISRGREPSTGMGATRLGSASLAGNLLWSVMRLDSSTSSRRCYGCLVSAKPKTLGYYR